jgi:hypothetical protein
MESKDPYFSRARSDATQFSPYSSAIMANSATHSPMPDPAEQLQRLYMACFELQTFDRYPKCIGVIRGECIALLVPGVGGLQILGTPGWRMGEVMGVLTQKDGRQVFQAKEEVIDATPERLEALQRFREDLRQLLKTHAEDIV